MGCTWRYCGCSDFKKKKKIWEARLLRIIKESENREKPWCSHFGICGGCRWQNMDYSTQLFYKSKWVKDSLLRLGKFKFPEPLPIIGSLKLYLIEIKWSLPLVIADS